MHGLWRTPILGQLCYKAWLWDARRKKSWFKDHISHSDKLIEIGSGPGSLLQIMRENGYNIDGLDIANHAYNTAFSPHIYDGHTMPYADKSYDVAILSTMLHHTADPDHILREAARIAHRLIIIEDVYDGPVMEWLTKRVDSLMNLEFRGHPHSNRTDQDWRESFKALSLSLTHSAQYPVAAIFRQAVYILKTNNSKT